MEISDSFCIERQNNLLKRVIRIVEYLHGGQKHSLIQLISFQVKLVNLQVHLQTEMSFKVRMT